MNLLNEDEVRATNISRITEYSDKFVYGVIDVFLFARNSMQNEVNMKVKEHLLISRECIHIMEFILHLILSMNALLALIETILMV